MIFSIINRMCRRSGRFNHPVNFRASRRLALQMRLEMLRFVRSKRPRSDWLD